MVWSISFICVCLVWCTGTAGGDKCVDISQYTPVLYKLNTLEICYTNIQTICQTKTEQVCSTVEEFKCQLTPKIDCQTKQSTIQVRQDAVKNSVYTSKVCRSVGNHYLTETHYTPQCLNVTKEVCEEKWVLNSAGEQFLEGKYNCVNTTSQDCEIQEYPVNIAVPRIVCEEEQDYFYPTVDKNLEKMTLVNTACTPILVKECSVEERNECIPVSWEECSQVPVPVCFKGITQSEPYQELKHNQRCLLETSVEGGSAAPPQFITVEEGRAKSLLPDLEAEMKIRSGKSLANILENGDIDHLSHLYDLSNMETQDVLHEPGLDADIEDDLTKYVQSDGRVHSPENTESLVNEKMCIRLGFEKSKTLKTKKDFEAKNENKSGNSNQKYSGNSGYVDISDFFLNFDSGDSEPEDNIDENILKDHDQWTSSAEAVDVPNENLDGQMRTYDTQKYDEFKEPKNIERRIVEEESTTKGSSGFFGLWSMFPRH